jgi:hypothetical protein
MDEKLTGFKVHRHGTNPKEKELHDKFIEWYVNDHSNMDLLVFPPANNQQTKAIDTLSDREKQIVITMVQWMGTPLGQSLLRECGFEQVEKKSEWVKLTDPKGREIFKNSFYFSSFVYLEDNEPSFCSSTIKWLDKVEVRSRNSKRAANLAWEYLNEK